MDTLQLEKELSFDSFTNEMGFEIANNIVREVKEKGLKPVRIRVEINKEIVFQYLMDGKHGEEWLNRKQKTVHEFGHCSYYVWETTNQDDPIVKDSSYAICGGGFPIIVKGEVIGSIIVSGLVHDQDHQLIVNGMKKYKEEH